MVREGGFALMVLSEEMREHKILVGQRKWMETMIKKIVKKWENGGGGRGIGAMDERERRMTPPHSLLQCYLMVVLERVGTFCPINDDIWRGCIKIILMIYAKHIS